MTTTPQPPSKAELLDALRASGADALARLRALPPADFERGRYENGWNSRQILAHIASIEWTYTRLFDVAKQATPPQALPQGGERRNVTAHPDAPGGQGGVRRSEPGEGGLPTRTAQGGIDSYNERQVAKRAGAPVAELLDEFERNRAATIAAVEAADEALLGKEIRSAGGITGALAGVINAVAVLHVLGHVNDIVGMPPAEEQR
jgi:hypothetical protein